MRNQNSNLGVLFVCLAALASAGCTDNVTQPVDGTRTLEHARAGETTPLDTRARMGLPAAGGAAEFHHPPMGGGDAALASPAPDAGAPAITWTAPEGWTQGPAKQMRLVTLHPKDAPGVECYVTILGGAAGGVEANVNRWRQQLNLAPLAADAIAALPSVTVLGRPSHMVEIDGGAAGLFGLVCELGEETVFVKMTGPMDALRGQREGFAAFCKSLSQQ